MAGAKPRRLRLRSGQDGGISDILINFLTGGRFQSDFDLQSRGVEAVNRASSGITSDPVQVGLSAMSPEEGLANRPDLGKHALASQAIADRFGPTVARAVGLGKEGLDTLRILLGGAGPSMEDLTANEIGIANSQGSFLDFIRPSSVGREVTTIPNRVPIGQTGGFVGAVLGSERGTQMADLLRSFIQSDIDTEAISQAGKEIGDFQSIAPGLQLDTESAAQRLNRPGAGERIARGAGESLVETAAGMAAQLPQNQLLSLLGFDVVGPAGEKVREAVAAPPAISVEEGASTAFGRLIPDILSLVIPGGEKPKVSKVPKSTTGRLEQFVDPERVMLEVPGDTRKNNLIRQFNESMEVPHRPSEVVYQGTKPAVDAEGNLINTPVRFTGPDEVKMHLLTEAQRVPFDKQKRFFQLTEEVDKLSRGMQQVQDNFATAFNGPAGEVVSEVGHDFRTYRLRVSMDEAMHGPFVRGSSGEIVAKGFNKEKPITQGSIITGLGHEFVHPLWSKVENKARQLVGKRNLSGGESKVVEFYKDWRRAGGLYEKEGRLTGMVRDSVEEMTGSPLLAGPDPYIRKTEEAASDLISMATDPRLQPFIMDPEIRRIAIKWFGPIREPVIMGQPKLLTGPTIQGEKELMQRIGEINAKD